MTKIKKLLVLVLAGALALCVLTGCGGGGGSAEESTPQGPVEQIMAAFNAGRKAVGLPLLKNTYGDTAAHILALFDQEKTVEDNNCYTITEETVNLPTGYSLMFVEVRASGEDRSTYRLRKEDSYSRLQGACLLACAQAGFLTNQNVGVAAKEMDGETYCVVVIESSAIAP